MELLSPITQIIIGAILAILAAIIQSKSRSAFELKIVLWIIILSILLFGIGIFTLLG